MRNCVLLCLLAGCTVAPPPPPTPRAAIQVDAPVAVTWRAMAEVFAEDGIPLRALDPVSGYATADKVPIRADVQEARSDCGHGWAPGDHAVLSIVVRGDSLKSTVKASGKFTREDAGFLAECTTKGAWESSIEQRIKAKAERSHQTSASQ